MSQVRKKSPGVVNSPNTPLVKQNQYYKQWKLILSVIIFSCIVTYVTELELFWKPTLIYLSKLRNGYLDTFMITMGYFGFEFFFILLPVSCFAGNFKNIGRKHSFGFDLTLLLLYTWLLGSLVKTVFQRLRPYQLYDDVVLTPDHMLVLEYSFPSGHSFGSMVSWSFLYDRLKVGLSKPQKIVLYIFTWAIVILASSSRIYFCVHYPHDIIAGWLFAIILYRIYSDWDVLTASYTLYTLVFSMIVFCIFSSTELLFHMPGLLLGTSSLFSIVLCMNFVKYLPVNSPLLNNVTPSSPYWKRFLRVVLGFSFFLILIYVRKNYDLTVFLLAFFGFLINFWFLVIAPFLFGTLKLY